MKLSKLLFLIVLIIGFAISSSLIAQVNYYVDPLGTDDGAHGGSTGTGAWKTIEYAVNAVANPTTATIVINVAAGTYNLYSASITDPITIDNAFTDLTILGEGSSNTFVEGAAIVSDATTQVFNINGTDENVTLQNLTIRNGSSFGSGHGIQNFDATLTLVNCVISGNEGNNQGAIFNNDLGNLTMTNCTVSGNNAIGSNAGGIINRGTLTMTNCTIKDNTCGSSSGGGGIYNYQGTITLTNCTISGNEAGWGGGGIYNTNGSGGASISLINCTISGNTTSDVDWGSGAGIYNDAAIVTLVNSTISGNSNTSTDSDGGGVALWGGTLNIKNTIIANNTYASGNDDYYYNSGTLTDNGYNIVEITNVAAGAGGFTNGTNNDIVGEQASLNLNSILADNSTLNGTQTLALSSGSVAINAGTATDAPANDQRGFGRNGATDIGAYEFDAPVPVELTTFTATFTSSETVVLNWATATEINNYGFSVEQSCNLFPEWQEIGFVNGHGNSNSPKEYSFVASTGSATNVSFRLKQIDTDGSFEYSDVVEVLLTGTMEYKLAQNSPNPFNPSTNISFTIPKVGVVKLNIYNVLGEVVAELVNKNLEVGFHQYQFNGRNFTSGIYFYSISVNEFREVKKMNLIK